MKLIQPQPRDYDELPSQSYTTYSLGAAHPVLHVTGHASRTLCSDAQNPPSLQL